MYSIGMRFSLHNFRNMKICFIYLIFYSKMTIGSSWSKFIQEFLHVLFSKKICINDWIVFLWEIETLHLQHFCRHLPSWKFFDTFWWRQKSLSHIWDLTRSISLTTIESTAAELRSTEGDHIIFFTKGVKI